MSVVRLLKWALVFLLARFVWDLAIADELHLGPFEKSRPRQLIITRGSEPFDIYEALHGSFSSAEQCADVPNGLWIEVDGAGDCIRYYAHGLNAGQNPKVMVYLAGDVILRTSKGVRFVGASYRQRSPESIQSDMEQWSMEAGVPAVYLARPGMYGSSGDHKKRRLPREIALMDAALDTIKGRYQIAEFILAGHSGGGHIVASLLNRRQDVSAVAITSGLVSVKQVVAYYDRRRKVPDSMVSNTKDFYDPVTEIDRIRRTPLPQIYVISDPEDHIVPFFSQLYYVRRLRALGFSPQHVYAHAVDKNRHVLARYARLAAALAARNETTRDILKALDRIDLEQVN